MISTYLALTKPQMPPQEPFCRYYSYNSMREHCSLYFIDKETKTQKG